MAREKGCTPAQLALAWLLAQDNRIVPIPGTRGIKRLGENAAAVEYELSLEDLDRLEAIAPAGFAAGTRYPEAGMRAVNQ
jgi:aryl-alcohol dehydrogenase-like predicted oxidoreductase